MTIWPLRHFGLKVVSVGLAVLLWMAVSGETTASVGAATNGRANVCASICHAVETCAEARVRRVGINATSARW